jgi:hypothetical protein
MKKSSLLVCSFNSTSGVSFWITFRPFYLWPPAIRYSHVSLIHSRAVHNSRMWEWHCLAINQYERRDYGMIVCHIVKRLNYRLGTDGATKSVSITITAFKPKGGEEDDLRFRHPEPWTNLTLLEAVRNLHQDNAVFGNAEEKLLPPRIAFKTCARCIITERPALFNFFVSPSFCLPSLGWDLHRVMWSFSFLQDNL